MPLNWDVSEVKNHEELTTSPYDPQKWHPVTAALIDLTMVCGYSSITEENYVEVADRLAVYQKIFGPQIRWGNHWDNAYITLEDVKLHIGLWTNASKMTKAKFNNHMIECALRESWSIKAGTINTSTGPLWFVDREKKECSAVEKCHHAAVEHKESLKESHTAAS